MAGGLEKRLQHILREFAFEPRLPPDVVAIFAPITAEMHRILRNSATFAAHPEPTVKRRKALEDAKMLAVKTLVPLLMVLGLAGCATGTAPSRNLTDTGLSVAAPVAGGRVADGMMVEQTQYNVARITVDVPRSLRVSEANVFYPVADIVWL